MKKVIAIAIMCLFLGAGAAFAAGTGIVGSFHDLSPASANSLASGTQENAEICVWCHTPHWPQNAQQGAGNFGAPLWNKGSISTTFTAYGTTVEGTTTTSPSGVSLACLSCHDGVDAINSIVLSPTDNAGDFQYYTDAGSIVAMGSNTAGQAYTMASVAASTWGDTDLGTSMVNLHPVSISYTAGQAGLQATSTGITGFVGVPATATINNLLFNGKVECASCHDPHTQANPDFLRHSNTESALCLTCHGDGVSL